ncbi:adenosylhomocysteinase [Subtercola sp. YIM 133946]|uniref:adenosylhomocysteinase n=1 Tax=Subtercola sp. YIM 133946 TaxID=3118909 RepID=UPI002F926E90
MTPDSPTQAELAAAGEARLGWIRSRMHLLREVRADFERRLPFDGMTIGVGLHTEPKTVVLFETLAAGGATVIGTGNHGSTQDDMVAALATKGITIYGRRDDTLEQHIGNLNRTLDAGPDMLLDNGADLAILAADRGLAGTIVGGTEETTSGGLRLRDEADGRIPFPVLVINDSPLKAIAENRHAVGQSTVESFMRITNLQIPGRRFVVVGYGWCGRGVAQYLRSLGGVVAVVDSDELKAFEAAYDGYRVGTIEELAPWADAVITATGHANALPAHVFETLADGAVIGNVGHFLWEIDVPALKAAATDVTIVATALERIDLPNGRHVVLIAEGRMFNLAGTQPKGNSIESMDLGFMLQALSLERVALNRASLVPGPQPIPDDINRHVARRVLAVLGASR